MVNYLSIIMGLLLALAPLAVLYRFVPLQLKTLAVALLRMAAQLITVAVLTWILWHYDIVWATLLFVVLMTTVATFMLLRRVRLKTELLLLPVWASMLITTAVVGSFVLFAVLRPDHPLSARWVLPTAAVLLAHLLATGGESLQTYFEALRSDNLTYYERLGNGASRLQALTPYIGRALESLVRPAAANISVIALLSLPVLLSGLLMGGIQPVEAVFIYAVFVAASITASMLFLLITIWIADRRAFDRHGQLLDLFRK
ncbi:MAG: ABC transporter permease [Prevotella sp.]|nr:ABC transporter permease [Prevotella sp.]